MWHNEIYEAWAEALCLAERGKQYQVGGFVSVSSHTSFSSYLTLFLFLQTVTVLKFIPCIIFVGLVLSSHGYTPTL
jgi:hypothetical protein